MSVLGNTSELQASFGTIVSHKFLQVADDGTMTEITGSSGSSGSSTTVTDGTATMTGGVLTGLVSATASGTITAGTFTDGKASLSAGKLTSLVSASVTGTVNAGTLTDNVASLNAGALTGLVSATASGAVTAGTVTDGTATLTAGALTGLVSATASGAVTAGTLVGTLTGNVIVQSTAVTASSEIAVPTTTDAFYIVVNGSGSAMTLDTTITFPANGFLIANVSGGTATFLVSATAASS